MSVDCDHASGRCVRLVFGEHCYGVDADIESNAHTDTDLRTHRHTVLQQPLRAVRYHRSRLLQWRGVRIMYSESQLPCQ